MGLKPTKSSTVELHPLVLLKDWFYCTTDMFCALQPAMPLNDKYTTLSIGVLRKWVGYVKLTDKGLLECWSLGDGYGELIDTFSIYDPESFPKILEIMNRNR